MFGQADWGGAAAWQPGGLSQPAAAMKLRRLEGR